MKWLTGNFKRRLSLSYIFIILFSFSFIAFSLDKNLRNNASADLNNSLLDQALLIESQLSQDIFFSGNLKILQAKVEELNSKIKSRITIIGPDGTVLADSDKTEKGVLEMENHADRQEVKAAFSGFAAHSVRYSKTLDIDMLYVTVPKISNEKVIGVVRVALPMENVKLIFGAIRKAVLFSLFFALIFAYMLGVLLSRSLLRPIDRIIYASRNFSKGNFSQKILIDSTDEMAELAVTLNQMAEDIENKITEVELQNQHLRAILKSMVEGIIVVAKEGRIISINRTVEKIFDIKQENSEGKLLLEVIPNDDICQIVNKVLSGGEAVSKELNLSWPVQKIFKVVAVPVFEKEAVNSCLVVIHDMTQIRQLETMRKDFVANVSHELKTPLTSIKGFVETLLEGALEDKEHASQFLKIIHEHTNRLDSLVNDLLDLSYLEAKGTLLKKENFDLTSLTDGVLNGFRSQVEKKKIAIKNDLGSGVMVKADKDKIRQVLINLIDNAIKFNKPNGSIRIFLERVASGQKIIVEDTGTGIPQKDIPRIFERFYRVDKARSRELGGTGLGLSIVKHIVELHGGSVGVESNEGIGSAFWFIIP